MLLEKFESYFSGIWKKSQSYLKVIFKVCENYLEVIWELFESYLKVICKLFESYFSPEKSSATLKGYFSKTFVVRFLPEKFSEPKLDRALGPGSNGRRPTIFLGDAGQLFAKARIFAEQGSHSPQLSQSKQHEKHPCERQIFLKVI